MPSSCAECCELLCSVIFPPLGVFAKKGCGLDLAINILLTILGYFPGKRRSLGHSSKLKLTVKCDFSFHCRFDSRDDHCLLHPGSSCCTGGGGSRESVGVHSCCSEVWQRRRFCVYNCFRIFLILRGAFFRFRDVSM